ncbi:MAG: DUF72 domain-containing protein [Acidobacteriota bacterium]|nr:DUF72 domain-containing protein [Acidobacteriota bacterium]
MGSILVGTAGWSYKDWEGVVYPPGLKRKQHPVEYLAQFVDCIEINSSFYGHTRPEVAKLWCRKAAAVNPEFRFTAKLYKAFTHSPIAVVQPTSSETIRATESDEHDAKQGLDVLAAEGKLGALLVQFPVSFKNTNENRDWLDAVIQKFNEYPLVVEVRHSSWNNEGILRYFAEKGVAFCNIDQPKLGKSLHPTEHVTSSVGYVRLHGRNYREWFDSDNRDDRYNYLYTADELEGWKERIMRIAEKAEKTYAVANNHFRGQAAVNAIQLKRLLGQPAKAPDVLAKQYPELKEWAEIVPA